MRRAFTIIELLVVITVIAILAAILFPVFARARENGRRVVCISNLRQIGCALGSYLPDWDDMYPWAYRAFDIGAVPTHPQLWEAMSGYTRDARIWVCPSDTGETFLTGPMSYHRLTPPFHSHTGLSYGYLGLESPIPVLYYGFAGYPSSKIRRPSSTMIMSEFRPWHGNYRRTEIFLNSPGLFNVLYCDGHIAQKTARQWYDEQNAAFRP